MLGFWLQCRGFVGLFLWLCSGFWVQRFGCFYFIPHQIVTPYTRELEGKSCTLHWIYHVEQRQLGCWGSSFRQGDSFRTSFFPTLNPAGYGLGVVLKRNMGGRLRKPGPADSGTHRLQTLSPAV